MSRKTRKCAENELIFNEGDKGDCGYLIERGRVLIFVNKSDGEIPLKVLGKGEVFGEMSLIDNSPRSASVRAMDDAQLIVVTREQLLDRIQVADPIVRLLMRALLARLRFQNDTVRGRTLEIEEPSDDDKQTALKQIELENRIAAGLDRDEFVPWYQPIYDLKTLQISGCEALMRWTSGDEVIAGPGTFVEAMENSSLIITAGRKLIDKVFTDMKAIHVRFPNFFVSINVSGRQFADVDFLPSLESMRERFGIEPQKVKLEVTERVMMEGPLALRTLEQCHKAGYQLAIDDFGTGFSSLQYLASMPLHDLKVDRAFVSKMTEDQKALSIVKSLVHLADLLGLKIIAEGIETEMQKKLLCELGVGFGQGYLFSKPVPFKALLKILGLETDTTAA